MKKSPAILILLLALLMQLRVAYGCAVPAELVGAGCDRHGLLALPADAPTDDEGGCHGSIDLASRPLRADEDVQPAPSGSGNKDAPAFLADAHASLLPRVANTPVRMALWPTTAAPVGPGARTYLVTARLRL